MIRWLPVVLLLACGPVGLDRSRLITSRDRGATLTDVPVLGYPVRVTTRGEQVQGELLVADRRGMQVLSGVAQVVDIPWNEVEKVRLDRHNFSTELPVWAALGGASTLTHGFVLVFTFPMWVAAGTTASVVSWRQAHPVVRPGRYDILWQYARYPAGRPQDGLLLPYRLGTAREEEEEAPPPPPPPAEPPPR